MECALVMSDYDAALSFAEKLPPAERLRLIDALYDSLPDEFPPVCDEWMAEINRRSDEFDAGRARTIPFDEVEAAAMRRINSALAD